MKKTGTYITVSAFHWYLLHVANFSEQTKNHGWPPAEKTVASLEKT